MPAITRAISLTNFLVATTALGFQVTVLYPWHKQLDEDFEKLKHEHLRVLNTIRAQGGSTEPLNLAAAAATTTHQATVTGPGLRERLGNLVGWTLATGRHSTSVLPSSATALVATTTQLEIPASQTILTPPTQSVAIAKPLALEPDKDNLKPSGAALYARYALAGAICCSLTHAILTPIDIVKTRMQLDLPHQTTTTTTASTTATKRGLITSLRSITTTEGLPALTTGLGPTVAGYFLQGAFKFGGYEFLKARAVDALGGREAAARHRSAVYLSASALAEVAGDLALCPFEAVRIRLVAQPGFARGRMGEGFVRMVREEGVAGLYRGLGPILLKQVPYTATTFLVYEHVLEQAYKLIDQPAAVLGPAAVTGINLGCGLVAGFAAAVVSHPADTWLSKVNGARSSETPGQGMLRRLVGVARDTGFRGSFAGLPARLVMVGGMTAVQFAIYGDIKAAIGATGGIDI